jgi:hypothetical protein
MRDLFFTPVDAPLAPPRSTLGGRLDALGSPFPRPLAGCRAFRSIDELRTIDPIAVTFVLEDPHAPEPAFRRSARLFARSPSGVA